jgi:hypothetical protein
MAPPCGSVDGELACGSTSGGRPASRRTVTPAGEICRPHELRAAVAGVGTQAAKAVPNGAGAATICVPSPSQVTRPFSTSAISAFT